ncbi:hypothetical protein [Cupriavidus oxalaticus]|uniref:hypothetical protein n=1 Tax=Cupriavidus TaxID=106589 RepID=UPI00197A8112|nr:hypothetical protein [Cupriavidus oxalaticus]
MPATGHALRACLGPGRRIKRWRDIWSAGHSVSGVAQVESVAELVARTRQEFDAARAAACRALAPEAPDSAPDTAPGAQRLA